MTVLAFHAEWCGPCDQQEPIIDQLVADASVSVERYDIDTDEGMRMANEYGVRSVPTTVVVDGDTVVETFTGITDESTIRDAL